MPLVARAIPIELTLVDDALYRGECLSPRRRRRRPRARLVDALSTRRTCHTRTSMRMPIRMPCGPCPGMLAHTHTRPSPLPTPIAEARTTQILQDINEASMLGTFTQLGLLVSTCTHPPANRSTDRRHVDWHGRLEGSRSSSTSPCRWARAVVMCHACC